MRNMKLSTLIVLIVMMFVSFTEGKSQVKDWTMLVYMVGSDLEEGQNAFASTDLVEMVTGATSTQYVNVIVVAGGSNKPGWQTPTTYLIANGQQTTLSYQLPDANMANPQNITDFITWGTQNYPAQSYMVTFWNHGGGTQGYGHDSQSDKMLTVPQIAQGIGNSTFIQNGTKFDVIGFDACLMGNLEVQTILKDYAYYFVGSEETEPGHGWNYTPIIEAMEAGNALYGDEIGTIIVNSFKAHANANGTSDITLSVTDLSYAVALEAKIEALLTKIEQDGKVKKLQQARAQAEEYGKSASNQALSFDVVDIGDMMKKLKAIDPSLAPEVDSVLAVLQNMVVHNTKGSSRPRATGMTMYLPHEVLSSVGETEYIIDSVYTPLGIPVALKNFVKNTYLPIVTSDNTAPGGTVDPNFAFKRASGDSISAITIVHDDDLEEVQIVLDEELVGGTPTQYILLGSTLPDTVVYNSDGTETYAYKWDGQWLGINGHPAYIADIHEFVHEDSMGNPQTYTRVHLPAIYNPGTPDETTIKIGYVYDADFNVTLESIVPEMDANRVHPKERITLQPGDQVQFVYEIFDMATDEEYFVPDPNAIFTITTGNEDLKLEHDFLEPGNYHIGYVLMDHSRNDTIIFDTKVFTVSGLSVEEGFAVNNIMLYPNPAEAGFSIDFQDFNGEPFKVQLVDLSGKTVYAAKFNQPSIFIETESLPAGFYTVELIVGEKMYYDKLIIQH